MINKKFIENNAEIRAMQYLQSLLKDLRQIDTDNSLSSMLTCFEIISENTNIQREEFEQEKKYEAKHLILDLIEKHNFSKDYAIIF